MNTYSTVEDYLEVLAGMRDPATGKMITTWFFGFNPIISLARYDVDVLTSMSEATANQKALTEKQGSLLCKILLKYQRQLAAKHIDVSPIENPVWRQPLRTMDYTHSLSIDDGKIHLRFPFSTKLIEDLRSFKSSSQGGCAFNRDAKVWVVGLTEFNLNWLHTWAKANNFEISEEVEALNNLILAAEAVPHKIELCYGADQLEITNCPNSLREYIETHLGGFGHDNVLRLIDASSVLGFTIEEALRDVTVEQWGVRALTLSSNREVRIDPTTVRVEEDLASVLEYAVNTNRLPVVVYEPDLSEKLLRKLHELYPAEVIEAVGNNKNYVPVEGVKFIHTHKPMRKLDRIPMLVSSAGMIFGGDKQIMVQRAEKIVYVSADVYNAAGGTGQKTRKVVKLAG
jgi:hypothetical protein